MNNYLFLFNSIHITSITFRSTNTNNLRRDPTCYKTKNIFAQYWILLMPQMTITIVNVFDYTDEFIATKGSILVVKVSILTPKQV